MVLWCRFIIRVPSKYSASGNARFYLQDPRKKFIRIKPNPVISKLNPHPSVPCFTSHFREDLGTWCYFINRYLLIDLVCSLPLSCVASRLSQLTEQARSSIAYSNPYTLVFICFCWSSEPIAPTLIYYHMGHWSFFPLLVNTCCNNEKSGSQDPPFIYVMV